jgi:multicomponent Na+:H+ antiporter subunit B
MSRRLRLTVFGLGAAGLAVVFAAGFAGLPAFGTFRSAYGELVARSVGPERHATGVVSATTFDYRGFDTLGEEFILFACVIGVTAILRLVGAREREGEEDSPEPSNAVRAIGLGLVGPTVLIGLYVTVTGALTPGGGFQGGVLLSSALLLVFVAGSAVAMKRLRPEAPIELAEAAGVLGFALIGIGGLVFASAFFENFLPPGTTGSIFSAGTIQLSSVAVGVEVAGGFVLIVSEFLEQDLLRRREGG